MNQLRLAGQTLLLMSLASCDDAFGPPAPELVSAVATSASPSVGELVTVSWHSRNGGSLTVTQNDVVLYATSFADEVSCGTTELTVPGNGPLVVNLGGGAKDQREKKTAVAGNVPVHCQ